MEFLYFAVFNYLNWLNWYFVRYFIPFVKFPFYFRANFYFKRSCGFCIYQSLVHYKTNDMFFKLFVFFYQVILKLCYNV